jgi:hypothetical protein
MMRTGPGSITMTLLVRFVIFKLISRMTEKRLKDGKFSILGDLAVWLLMDGLMPL